LNVPTTFFENKSTKNLVDDLFLECQTKIIKIYSDTRRKLIQTPTPTPVIFSKKNDNPFNSEKTSRTLKIDQTLKESEIEKVEKREIKSSKKKLDENEKTEKMIKTNILENKNLPKINIWTGVNETFKNSKKFRRESPSSGRESPSSEINLKNHVIELKLAETSP